MEQLPKSLMIAADYVLREVTRLMTDAKIKPMTRQDWDKVNALFDLFYDGIYANDDYKKAKELEMELERKCIK